MSLAVWRLQSSIPLQYCAVYPFIYFNSILFFDTSRVFDAGVGWEWGG